jgi:2-amino-4-hydroxy-6-hydroxymethyldihydropteridine diphosphokinase
MIAEDALVIGLGGNVGGDAAIIECFRRARGAFAAIGDVRSAALYRTGALVPGGLASLVSLQRAADLPAFLNTALRVRWGDAEPAEVIATVLEIERLLGRDRRGEPRWGPRTIDLDVLVWGTRVICTPELEVPHPRLFERRFALRPLADIVDEDTVLPGTTDTLAVLLARAREQPLEQLQPDW